jgi:hypothetical protein
MCEQILGSYTFWHHDSGDSFDILLPGWIEIRRNLEYWADEFAQFVADVERESSWRYSGLTDLVLLDYNYDISIARGGFRLAEAYVFELESMPALSSAGGLDRLIRQVVVAARDQPTRGEDSVLWRVAGSVAMDTVRSGLFAELRTRLLGKAGGDAAQFAIGARPRDLRPTRPRLDG